MPDNRIANATTETLARQIERMGVLLFAGFYIKQNGSTNSNTEDNATDSAARNRRSAVQRTPLTAGHESCKQIVVFFCSFLTLLERNGTFRATGRSAECWAIWLDTRPHQLDFRPITTPRGRDGRLHELRFPRLGLHKRGSEEQLEASKPQMAQVFSGTFRVKGVRL